jgi:5-methylcytosine-specific restriction protein A
MAWSKLSRHKRGYGSAWDKIRKRIMERDCGLCQACAKQGKVTIASAVDHIINKAKAAQMRWTPEQVDAESNLQAICDPCHLEKTQVEQGKRKRPRVTISADGWPVRG